MADRALSLFLAGDAMITRPWSRVTDRAFLDLVAEIRAAEVAIVNLETVIHEFQHPAQADSGGTWMASPPEVAAELKWAGFGMLAHANNHAFDYGSGGVLDTLRHAAEAGLVLSGSGADLQAARAPGYLRWAGGVVAHVSMTSTFTRYGKASPSRPDLAGRPGVNPLAPRSDTVLRIPPRLEPMLRAGNRLCRRFGIACAPGARLRLQRGRRPLGLDLKANLAAIEEAAATAGLVVVSLHAHARGRWLARFAHRAIAAGAGAIVMHGPHRVLGVELYRGRPIFYGLGDFAYEPEGVARFPQEAYDALRLPAGAGVEEARAAMRRAPPSSWRETYEGAAAVLRFEAGRLVRLELLPLDLQFDAAPDRRGRPQLAEPTLGRRIIERIAAQSAAFGTQVRYDEAGNRGVVTIGE